MIASTEPRLVLMCGLPGAGKTTIARRLEHELPAIRLCPDEWMAQLGIDMFDEPFRERLEIRFWSLTQSLLAQGANVILESGFWLRTDRDEKRLGARKLGARVELRYLEVSGDELLRRLEMRNTDGDLNAVPIGRELLEHWTTFFEAPDVDELALFDSSL